MIIILLAKYWENALRGHYKMTSRCDAKVNPLCAELFWGNMNVYMYLLWSLDTHGRCRQLKPSWQNTGGVNDMDGSEKMAQAAWRVMIMFSFYLGCLGETVLTLHKKPSRGEYFLLHPWGKFSENTIQYTPDMLRSLSRYSSWKTQP